MTSLPKTVQMWSARANAVVEWSATKTADEIVLSYDDGAGRDDSVEELRFSPNLSYDRPKSNPDGSIDFSLSEYIDDVNARQNHDRNARPI
jgi:hypothetical protein